MKKGLLLAIFVVSLFLCCLPNDVMAGGVALDRAKAVAQNWLHNSMSDTSLGISAEYKIIGEEPILFNEKTVGYNFLLSPAGHIIVPSRDELPVVKLYSFTTTVSMADNSEVAQWISEELSLLNESLDDHASELATVDYSKTFNGRLWGIFARDEAEFSQNRDQLQTESVVSLGPLLSTTWNQGSPYNLYTPLWYDGQATVTGCVATAAAQIMKYWNYPPTGQGSTSYTWNDGSVNRTLGTDFSQSTYRWSDMTSTYGPTSTSSQRDAVAKLMVDVGIAFHMSYGKSTSSGSSAATLEGAAVFPNYFRYKNTAHAVYRSSYPSDSAWMQVFKGELQNGRPSQLRIRDPRAGGHSIVIDGYRDSPSEQIHLNLGWSGSYDGWYVSNNINTGSYSWSDVNYQAAVVGIEPATVTTTPAVSTKPATNVASAGASLNGTVTPNGVEVSAFFQYGTTTSYDTSTSPSYIGSGRDEVPVGADVDGLTCGGITYHYRMVASTASGTRYNGSDITFTTGACTQTPPTVTTLAATGVGQGSATLNGTVTPNGAAATARFDYGTTTSYGSSTTPLSGIISQLSVAASISGLTCGGITYHFRAVATNSGGTTNGADQTFTTAQCAQLPPTVTTGSATAVAQGSATLTGTVNPNGSASSAYFQYGRTAGYGSTTTTQGIGSGTSAVPLTAPVSGLSCGGVTYHFRAVSTNGGGPSYGQDATFSSGACPDIDPNPFTFTAQTDVPLSTAVTSNAVVISGIDAAAPISITSGGSYSINDGAYATAAATVNNGDTVRVRLTSSPNYSTDTTKTLTIGGVSGTFSATTIADGGRANILLNPGFESGALEWSSYSSGGYQLITNLTQGGNNGSDWFAYLAGGDNLTESVHQDVAIPSTATAATLSFYYYIFTDETTISTVYDTMNVQLLDPTSGSILATLKTLSNLSATTDWTVNQPIDLMAYRGRTVRVKFIAATDSSAQTMFLVDDVALTVTTGNTTPPTVVSTTPANGAGNIPLNSLVTATFSKAITPSTLTTSTFGVSPSLSGTVSYDATSMTATFTPSTTLAPGTLYTASVTTGVTDVSGNALATARSWSFTTTSGAVATNLLANGDFESGRVAWAESNSAGNANINLNTGLGHNGSNWYIYTGIVHSLVSATYQDVTIPSGATEAYTRFWYRITSDESSTTTPWDKMEVLIQDPSNGATLQTLKSFSNLDKTTGWVESARYDLMAYRGQTVRLNFYVTTDSSVSTGFRVDDVTVAVTQSTVDVDPPTVTGFVMPATSTTLAVPITTLTATDNVGVTGFMVTESATTPPSSSSGWLAAAPTTFTFASSGSRTAYAWAKDAIGNVSAAATQTVSISGGSVPGAPRNVTAAGGASLAVITFTAPTSDGGSAITGYTVTSSPGSITATGTASPITVTGLTNGTAYTFTVTATNAIGTGAASEASGAVTPSTVAPPALSVSTLPDGSVTNNATLNVTGTVTSGNGIKSLTVNGRGVTVDTGGGFSTALTLQEGGNTISVVATDNVDQSTTDTRTVMLDTTAPSLTVSVPADNSYVKSTALTITGTINEASIGSVTATVGTSAPLTASIASGSYTVTVNLAAGSNTVNIVAIDLAGNSTTMKRTITVDAVKPELSVTDPGQDITIHTSSYLLKGTVGDTSTTAITITADGKSYTPTAASDGTFQQQITFSAENTFAVVVAAADAAGNTSTVQRNFIYTLARSGDIDGDQAVTVADALLALQIALGNVTVTPVQLTRGDVAPLVYGAPQPDGAIDAGDALVILEKSVNLVTW